MTDRQKIQISIQCIMSFSVLEYIYFLSYTLSLILIQSEILDLKTHSYVKFNFDVNGVTRGIIIKDAFNVISYI